MLHLFSGRVNTAEFPGDTCDVNAALEPTFVADAHDLTGVPIEDYYLILADPPYSAEDADHYGTPLVSRNKVVEVLSHRMQPDAHLAWLDQAQPMYAKARLKPEAAIGIVRSPPCTATAACLSGGACSVVSARAARFGVSPAAAAIYRTLTLIPPNWVRPLSAV